jgi:hypothetical protein
MSADVIDTVIEGTKEGGREIICSMQFRIPPLARASFSRTLAPLWAVSVRPGDLAVR